MAYCRCSKIEIWKLDVVPGFLLKMSAVALDTQPSPVIKIGSTLAKLTIV